MSILLLVGLLASAVTLVTVVALCLRAQFRRAGRIVFRWAACAAAYAAILLLTAMLPNASALKTGVPYCDDDLCMIVRSVSATPGPAGVTYRFAIRLFTRANQGTRSAKGATAYLTDQRNRRFPPVYDPSAIPFDVAIEPGQSVSTSLTFTVPADAHALVFGVGVDRIQYASFIIGNGDLLHHPRLKLRIQ
jgi:hypothetical protein